MKRIGLILFLVSGFWFLVSGFCISAYAQQTETLQILTYYPAPYGVYKNLKTTEMLDVSNIVGTNTAGEGHKLRLSSGTVGLFGFRMDVGNNNLVLDKNWESTVDNWSAVLAINRNTGNVGIGTTDPKTKLHVQGGWLKVGDDGSAANSIQLETQDGFHRIAFKELRFYDWDFGDDMVTFNDGNVGIGMVPGSNYKLSVQGTISVPRGIYSNGTDIGLYASSMSMTGQAIYAHQAAAGGYVLYADGANTNNYFQGNVGIGDLTPLSALTVGDGDKFQVNSSGNIVKINNLPYSWPSSQAAGYLRSDNAGVLSWASAQSALKVQESDVFPSVNNVSTINVSNGTLTDNGSGTVTITTGGGGGGGGISGEGTANYIPKFTGGTAIGNSIIFQSDSNSNIGIGTNNPTANFILDVAGALKLRSESNPRGLYFYSDENHKIWVDRPSNHMYLREYGDIQFDVGSSSGTDVIINSSGNVGIGTINPTHGRLEVANTSQTAIYGISTNADGVYGESQNDIGVHGYSANSWGVYGGSNVSTGVSGNSSSGLGVYGGSGTSHGVHGYSAESYGVYGYSNSSYGVYGSGDTFLAGYFDGKVITTNSQTGATKHIFDIAELIPCAKDVEYGDIVVINPAKDREVIKCTKENQSAAGIISENPQLSFGDREKAREKDLDKNWNFIALAGQVYCKADASYGEINRGDLLTTSPTPGYAMKAKPIGEINGYPIYPQGCTIGKALEPLKEGKGKILVLVCLI